jgi:tRNA G18 (ribose-2'-O)-methylase SpoU
MNIDIQNLNVSDKYKFDRLTKWTKELIREDVQKNSFPYAVAMENWQGDFNLSSVIRNSNAFGAREVFYLGNKHYDRRGTVGTHHYTRVNHLQSIQELINLKDKYTIVGVENTVDGAVELDKFEFPDNPLFLFGEEGVGLTPESMAICDKFVYIAQYGSVRSLNAAVASGIIMNAYVSKIASK